MKNKIFLPLMEQMCMILLFSLVAVLCLRGFALAKEMSKEQQLLDNAVVLAQNGAESIKANKGNFGACAKVLGGAATESQWQLTHNELVLVAQKEESGQRYLGKANINVTYKEEVIFQIAVGWQEVS